jgi:plastocyanin
VRLAAVAIAITALPLAGCGDDDSDETMGAGEPATIEIDGEPANDEGTEAVTGDTVELEQDDFYFEPTVLTGDPGQRVTLEITNEGDEEHNLTVTDQGVDEDTEPGRSTTVEAEIPDSSVVPFYCSYHEAQNMRGALAVTGSEPTASSDSSDAGGSGYGGY